MTNSVRAIETRYAGCHFRSRLEARWAVFFDALGIRWEYEPQGFELNWRLLLDDEEPLHYLPDFYLPDLGVHVEVKGEWTSDEMEKFFNAAASMGTCRNDGNFTNFVALGSTDGYQYNDWTPWAFHFHKGDLFMFPWDPRAGNECPAPEYFRMPIASDYGTRESWTQHGYTTGRLARTLSLGVRSGRANLQHAIIAARSARFEHGQSGAA